MSVDELTDLISDGASVTRTIHFVNAYSIVCAQISDVHAALSSANLCVPDGVPVAAVARHLSGGKNFRATPGPLVMRLALKRAALTSRRHFFFGSTQDTLDALRAALEHTVPAENLAGFYSPPRLSDVGKHADLLVEQLHAMHADVVWVGLGTPKQDLFLRRMVETGPPGVTYLAVGAAFDFLAGTRREAPALIRGSGFEWLWRLTCEPRRLWRRYLLGNAVFLKLAWYAVRHASR